MSPRFSLDEPRLKGYTEPAVRHLVRLQLITFSSVVQVAYSNTVPIAILLVLCIEIIPFNVTSIKII